MTRHSDGGIGAPRAAHGRGHRFGALGGALALAVVLAACSQSTVGREDLGAAPSGAEAGGGTPDGPAAPPAPLGPIGKTSHREHAARTAWRLGGDEPTTIDIGQAEATGHTVVDLSDDWTPYIFTEKTPGRDDAKANEYRARYLALANDRGDQWGEPLGENEKNYLELYGIPPTLSVIWSEWQTLTTEVEPCLVKAGYDPSAFANFKGTIAFSKASQSTRVRQASWAKAALAKKAKKAKLDISTPGGLAAAATHPSTKALHRSWRAAQSEVDVITNAQKRFVCERMYGTADGRGSVQYGVFDSETTHALAAFERKHDIMGWGHFKADNVAMLARPPQVAIHGRLLRMVEERVVSAAGIVEDGSAAQWKHDFRWKDKAGADQPLRDLAGEFTAAAVAELGIGTPETARTKLAQWVGLGDAKAQAGAFEGLLVAVKLPALPEYYSDAMQLQAVIDRGDVWYDFPYDSVGNKLSQPRQRYPHLTLYVNYEGQKIPLVHWRTTIGAWRNEYENDEVVLKYKNSDVGDRVWKDIVAAPVWIPPTSTPPAELIKGYWRKGKFRKDVNYPEIGPGYRSAYGLVAGYHIKEIRDEAGNVKSEFDNSIRTHGSVDYMSILRRFSHGCHRLYNMDAVRMFSFILQHREYARMGQVPVGVRRELAVEDRSYTMKIPSRGYKYELAAPIPVTVTEGRVRGRRKSPISGAMKPPGAELVPEGELVPSSDVGPATADPVIVDPL